MAACGDDRLIEIERILTDRLPAFLQGRHDDVVYSVLNCRVARTSRSEFGFHAASTLFFAQITLLRQQNGEAWESEQALVVKAMPERDFIRILQNSKDQFFNETSLYIEIAPWLLEICASTFHEKIPFNLEAASKLFPKCFYASSEDGIGMVVLEDLRKSGYRIGGDEDMIMDYDHILLGVKSLARFHALSYSAKKKNRKEFEDKVVKTVRDSRRFRAKKDVTDRMSIGYYIFIRFTTSLVLEMFKEKDTEIQDKQHEVDDKEFTEKMLELQRIVSDLAGIDTLMKGLLTPEEPLSVLSHGDFNMNNMLYQYDDNNKPVAVKFLDFQCMLYCSPMIDLSFFLFVNCSPELRAEHFNHFFKTYHEVLLQAIYEFTDFPLEALRLEYSLEKFKREFSRHCLYGFIFACNFIVGNSAISYHDDPFEKYGDEMGDPDKLLEKRKNDFKISGAKIKSRVCAIVREAITNMQWL